MSMVTLYAVRYFVQDWENFCTTPSQLNLVNLFLNKPYQPKAGRKNKLCFGGGEKVPELQRRVRRRPVPERPKSLTKGLQACTLGRKSTFVILLR